MKKAHNYVEAEQLEFDFTRQFLPSPMAKAALPDLPWLENPDSNAPAFPIDLVIDKDSRYYRDSSK